MSERLNKLILFFSRSFFDMQQFIFYDMRQVDGNVYK